MGEIGGTFRVCAQINVAWQAKRQRSGEVNKYGESQQELFGASF